MSTAQAAGAEVQEESRLLLDLIDGPCPAPGQWGDEAYLRLTDRVNRLVELTDGVVELLPMPTDQHQWIVRWLFDAFRAYIEAAGGVVLFAPLRLRIREGKFREPDLLLVRHAQDTRRANRFWHGADLVVEVVSPDGAARDFVDKRRDYAEADIPEYWIVDPRTETVTVLGLVDGEYAEAGVFSRGDSASSRLLSGFEVPVTEIFDNQPPFRHG